MKSIFNLNKNLVKRASTSTAKKSLKLEDLMISFILKTGSFGNLKDQGIVLSVTDGVAKAIGLKTVSSGELVSFKNNLKGMALNLEKYQVGIIIFGNDRDIKQGDSVSRTYSIIKIPGSAIMLLINNKEIHRPCKCFCPYECKLQIRCGSVCPWKGWRRGVMCILTRTTETYAPVSKK